jgi:6-phosphogluconolactonase
MAGFVVGPMDTQTELPVFVFDNRTSACQATADALTASVTAAHNEGRRARIALSGGSSPAPAYKAFAAMDLDWSQVDIALVDDRWVELDDAGSNEAMIRDAFAAATGVTIYGMKTPDATPFEGAKRLNASYKALRPFDGIVMGMGPDAHTASWFAGSPQLDACLSMDTCETVLGVDASAAPVAGAYPLRITLTLPAVAESQQIIFLLFGADKKRVLTDAIDTAVTQAPIRALLDTCSDRCVVFWAN